MGAGGGGRARGVRKSVALGARVATWKGLYEPVLTTSVARAQYRGAGPLSPIHLALGVLVGQGASLA